MLRRTIAVYQINYCDKVPNQLRYHCDYRIKLTVWGLKIIISMYKPLDAKALGRASYLIITVGAYLQK